MTGPAAANDAVQLELFMTLPSLQRESALIAYQSMSRLLGAYEACFPFMDPVNLGTCAGGSAIGSNLEASFIAWNRIDSKQVATDLIISSI